MPFGVNTTVTNKGKAIMADRIRHTPATYTESPRYVAMGVGATGAARTAAASDEALSTEKGTRVAGTESVAETTHPGDTYVVSGQQTATEALKVDECGLFDAATVGDMFASATINANSLNNGDTITWTWKVQFT